MNKIVVIAPHTDDETLGAGGYLLKRKSEGDVIYWINVTNVKVEYGYSIEEVKRWNEIIHMVSQKFNFKEVFDLALEPSSLDKMEKSLLISMLRTCLDNIQPDIVLLPFYDDTHSDHRVVFDAAIACCKSFRNPQIKKVMCMEIISETDYAISDRGFLPNYFVDISDYIDEKVEILELYKSEVHESPFPRSVDAIIALAKYRGASCYSHYAEAFRIVKEVER